MRYAFVVATTYQLFNAIKILFEIKKPEDSVDLYFQNWSEQTNQLLERVYLSRLFDNIFQWNDNLSKKNVLYVELCRVLRIVLPRLRYRLMAITPITLPSKNYYNSITYTVGNDMEIILMNLNRKASIIGFDDGTGSYVENVFNLTGRIWTILDGRRIINNRILNSLYLNNPSMCLYDPNCSVEKISSLSSLSEQNKSKLYRIFDYNVKKESNKMYFLTFPYHERNLDEEKVKAIDNLIYSFSNDLIVRNHPRENRKRIDGINYDDSGILWELKCDAEINDECVLIAFCSTAQITPKMLYDKEPYLVFLYGLFDCEWIEGYANLVDRIKSSYKNKEKVLIPQTIEELESILNNFSHD